MQRNNPKAVGERSEVMVLAALLRQRHVVLQPFGDNQRYDLVVDLDGVFVRVQCKTARLVNGALTFATCSSQAHRQRGHQTYRGEAEYFGVYSPDLDRVFMVPVEGTGERSSWLRLEAPRNGQQAKVRYADQFAVESWEHTPR